MPPKKKAKVSSPKLEGSLLIEKLPGYFLMVCLIVTGFLLFTVLEPFVTTLFVAAVLTIAFFPIYKKISKAFGRFTRLSSLVSCFVVFLIFVLPLTLVIILSVGEAIETSKVLIAKFDAGEFDKYFELETWGFLTQWIEKGIDLIRPVYDFDDFDIQEFDFKDTLVNWGQAAASWTLTQGGNFLASISNLMFAFVLMLFSMYYFFQDGKTIVDKIGYISPLPQSYETELFSKINSMVKAIIFGVFLTAIAQGLLGGIGFAIVGISNPILWGVLMAFLSLMPLIGTALVWVPAALFLLFTGSYGSAIFLFIWGTLLVGSVDNILRPYLIGGKAHTYPLLTFFVILGGIFTLGLKGVVIGPLVLMLFVSFLHIYEVEYKKVLNK